MLYRDLCGQQVSLLGLGIMRLPCGSGGQADIDEATAMQIFDYLYENGVNYWDTAYFYHGGAAERFAGRMLKRYPQGSVTLTSKMPWSYADGSPLDPSKVFEEQLEACQVDHFDYYLIQNVHDSTIDIYLDRSNGIVDYVLEQKRKGRIRHLGFSAHANLDNLERFLNLMGDEMDFIQLQLNYLDWTLQKAQAKYELAHSAGLPIVVMEPLRGGRLANISNDQAREQLKALAPDATPAELSFRWLQGLPDARCVLSGMGSMEAAQENVRTFSEERTLTDQQCRELERIAGLLAEVTPCTECGYCLSHCPQGIQIPRLIKLYDDCRFRASLIAAMGLDAIPADQRADKCIGCGSCLGACPQSIDIPTVMAAMAEVQAKLPDPHKH